MKKILVAIGICVLLAAMPTTFAISTNTINLLLQNTNVLTKEIYKTNSPDDDPPDWANGNFSGMWGIDIWGEWHIPIGWMFGYYKHNTKFGYFYAGFADFGQQNVSWYIQGILFGPFMFGSIGENEYANETIFVGIGRYNNTDTNYFWRLMGEQGPTFFVQGTYTKFE